MQTQQLSALMRLSWKIQHSKKTSRSKSLVSAWVIYQQADITEVAALKTKHPQQHRNQQKNRQRMISHFKLSHNNILKN